MDYKHVSVLYQESLDNLNIRENKIYVDATLGGAGHSSGILEVLNNTGQLFCFDQDITAINNAKEKLKNYDNVKLIKDNFSSLKNHIDVKIDGIIFDLGVSSMQIDQPERGFSYMNDGPLDMRMDKDSDIDAKYIINNYPVSQLIKIFDKYGEEKNSKRIAHAIVSYREENEITTTSQLSELIVDAIPKKDYYNLKSHPAKRVFQALRIEVNKELEVFESSLRDALSMCNIGARICVISFHSLEDRICKYIFKEASEVSDDIKNLPIVPEEHLPKFKLVTRKPILPNEEELEKNSRSRSSKLRVLERIR